MVTCVMVLIVNTCVVVMMTVMGMSEMEFLVYVKYEYKCIVMILGISVMAMVMDTTVVVVGMCTVVVVMVIGTKVQ